MSHIGGRTAEVPCWSVEPAGAMPCSATQLLQRTSQCWVKAFKGLVCNLFQVFLSKRVILLCRPAESWGSVPLCRHQLVFLFKDLPPHTGRDPWPLASSKLTHCFRKTTGLLLLKVDIYQSFSFLPSFSILSPIIFLSCFSVLPLSLFPLSLLSWTLLRWFLPSCLKPVTFFTADDVNVFAFPPLLSCNHFMTVFVRREWTKYLDAGKQSGIIECVICGSCSESLAHLSIMKTASEPA